MKLLRAFRFKVNHIHLVCPIEVYRGKYYQHDWDDTYIIGEGCNFQGELEPIPKGYRWCLDEPNN